MGARQSNEVKRALRMVEQGMSQYAAALKVGVHPSTITRAWAKIVKNKVVDNQVVTVENLTVVKNPENSG